MRSMASCRFFPYLGTCQDPHCDITVHAATHHVVRVLRQSHKPPATHSDTLEFARPSAQCTPRTGLRGASLIVGTNFDENGGNTSGGQPLTFDRHTHQPPFLGNVHFGGTFVGRTDDFLRRGASPLTHFSWRSTFGEK